MRRRFSTLVVALLGLVLAASAVAIPTPASAQLASPWDGNPISQGLGPTYGEAWCAEAAPGSSIANQQEFDGVPFQDTLALMPQEAIGCTLDQFLAEAGAAGIPNRMSYSVIGQSFEGRDLYGVVVNALETPEQQRDYDRWQQLRSIMLTEPEQAQSLLEAWGPDVKLPIFIEANIHGGEEEGTDAMMQVIRDLVTTPYGENATVDSLLDHAILIVIPTENPDGRTGSSGGGINMNRDFLVQSQSEVRAEVAFQHQWLAPVGLAMHCCGNPTLIDGLTKPHNPGIDYDLFAYWNQRRLDANETAHAGIGQAITRPVNDWNLAGDDAPPPVGPAYAEGWDDWGPFYTQTYMAFYGVDSSTVEMCSNAACGGRFGSKRAQYVTFYSSAAFWVENRNAILHDQAEIFRRGLADEARPDCCSNPLLVERGFTEDQHNWMVEYPEAFVIPFDGTGQRSDAEANRMVQWLLDNGILVEGTNQAVNWDGQTFPKKSYVVWMDQPFRGLALTTLDAGQDVSERIGQLYAAPGAWSHGLLWGADVVEIPAGSTFAPKTIPITAPNPYKGLLLGGGLKTWFAVTPKGVSEIRAVLDLLRGGLDAEIAEASFTTSTGKQMPAGSVIFSWSAGAVAALQQAANTIGFDIERSQGPKPPTTKLTEAPRVAILVNSAAPTNSDTSQSLRAIFGSDADFVSVTLGTNSLQNAPTDPLLGFDVIYNAGQNFPTSASPIAQARLQAFFARGGGYIGTSQNSNNFAFLTGAGLVSSPLTQGSDPADGGIAIWNNAGGPVTGGYPSQDYLFLPSNITYFSATPTDAVIDGRYLPSTTDLFVAGLWLDREALVANAPMAVHGTTTANSRYAGLATNPFSRMDAEREWLWVGQAALWSNLTDEV